VTSRREGRTGRRVGAVYTDRQKAGLGSERFYSRLQRLHAENRSPSSSTGMSVRESVADLQEMQQDSTEAVMFVRLGRAGLFARIIAD